MRLRRLALPLIAGAGLSAGECTLVNPLSRAVADEMVRVGLALDDGVQTVQAGDAVWLAQRMAGQTWVAASLPAGGQAVLAPGAKGAPVQALATLRRDGDVFILENADGFAVKVPAKGGGAGSLPPPLLGVKLGAAWVGAGAWRTARTGETLTVEELGRGPVFAQVRLTWRFAGEPEAVSWDFTGREIPRPTGQREAYATVTITVPPRGRVAYVEDEHVGSPGEAWEFDVAAGWKPTIALTDINSAGAGGGKSDLKERGAKGLLTLEPGQTRMGEVLVQLMPRWNQHYDQGWSFLAADADQAVGAVVARASRWQWPHDNLIDVVLKPGGANAILRLPVRRGKRFWMLAAGPRADLSPQKLVERHAIHALNVVNAEYLSAWPGRGGAFRAEFPFSDNINPTGMWRNLGRQAVKNAGANAGKAGVGDLTYVQNLFHPDTYGDYWRFWSPENPNFFSDFIKRPVGMTADLKEHPEFARLAKLAEFKFREDLHHAITLPSGAGQECPGYLSHALGAYLDMAGVAKAQLGFDPAAWPYFTAAASFLVKTSQPIGDGKRRIHPSGDTHPPGADVLALAEKFGVTIDVATLPSEELAGFGAVLRNRPGTPQETFVSFKAGPNRGHYHGDQLSLHVCAQGRQVAIDHMCSYSPRADQEHLHNRVAFSTATMPWANMDGHERLIAFKTDALADIAVGQVESTRLRRQKERPPAPQPDPADWDQRWDVEPLATPLTYRRTVVLVKGETDYLVLRDQWRGPVGLSATFCLHALGEKIEQRDGQVDFERARLVVQPGLKPVYSSFPWSYNKGKDGKGGFGETTVGARFTAATAEGQFISVLWLGDPASAPPVTAVPMGVKVGGDEILFSGGLDAQSGEGKDGVKTAVVMVSRGEMATVLEAKAIDLARPQGEIGLFVPDAGYPFGDLPDWLIRQRAPRPDWYQGYLQALGSVLGGW